MYCVCKCKHVHVCTCMPVCHMCVYAPKGQKKASNPLEPKIQAVTSSQHGFWELKLSLQGNGKHELLSHLSSLILGKLKNWSKGTKPCTTCPLGLTPFPPAVRHHDIKLSDLAVVTDMWVSLKAIPG